MLACEGYPAAPRTGDVIDGIAAAEAAGAMVFSAGVALGPDDDAALVTAGGRVLAVTGSGPTVAAARDHAYRAVSLITWPGRYYRTDIARRQRSDDQEGRDPHGFAERQGHHGPAADTLTRYGIEADVRVMSAHRTPAIVAEFAATARDNGYAAIICGAGMAAHLAGAVAAQTTLPVIGVPLASGALNGVDALYSTVQMPKGIPVATVAVNGAMNAALLAVQMLAIDDADLTAELCSATARRWFANPLQRVGQLGPEAAQRLDVSALGQSTSGTAITLRTISARTGG